MRGLSMQRTENCKSFRVTPGHRHHGTKHPEYQVRENVASVAAALADPERTPEQNHQGWYERLIADGWQRGPTKDETAKTHPDLVPFDQLPEHEKQKDRLFIAIVRALAQNCLASLDP